MASHILLSTVVYKSILGRGSDEPQFKDWEKANYSMCMKLCFAVNLLVVWDVKCKL